MDWMPAFAFLVLLAATIYVFVFSNNRNYKLGYDKGVSESGALARDLAKQNQRTRLMLATATAELERLRDELLRMDRHTFINSGEIFGSNQRNG